MRFVTRSMSTLGRWSELRAGSEPNRGRLPPRLVQTMQNEPPPTDAIRRRWAMVRLGLGLIQIMGATMATIFLAQTGVNELSLGAVVVTSIATGLSVFLFGDRPGNRASSKFDSRS